MAPTPPSRPDLDDRWYRRCLAVGLLVSVALHVALVLGWRAGPGPGITGSGAEAPSASPPDRWRTGAVQAVAMQAPSREVEVPPAPDPVDAASPEVSAPRVAESAELASVELAPRSAGEPGGGREGAEAQPGGGSGRPPVPRSVLPEWDPPDDVRGTEVVVRVHVDSAGRPTGPVELDPDTPDEAFNRRLRDKVLAMEFSPARSGGRPVAGWAELTFVF